MPSSKKAPTIATSLDAFEKNFAKSYGENSLRRASALDGYEVISTGSVALDFATGVGGLVRGRLHEYWGPDGMGKSTLALLAVAEAQKAVPDRVVGWIDMEHSFDKPWAISHGVDVDTLRVYQPDSAEQVADALKDMIRSGFFSLIVLDSIGAMIPEVMKEKDADEATVGIQAKIVTRMVQIAAPEADKSKTCVLFINQVRANIGGGPMAGDMATGGKALRHSTTMKFRFRGSDVTPKKAKVGSEDRVVSKTVNVKLDRNRVAPPDRVAQITLFNQPSKWGPIGIDRADEATTIGIDLGIIEANGAWYTLPTTGEKLNGRDKVMEALREDPSIIEHIRTTALASVAHLVHDEEEPPEEAEVKPGQFRRGAQAAKAASKSA